MVCHASFIIPTQVVLCEPGLLKEKPSSFKKMEVKKIRKKKKNLFHFHFSPGQVTSVIFSGLKALTTGNRVALSKNFPITEKICLLSLPEAVYLSAKMTGWRIPCQWVWAAYRALISEGRAYK